MAEEMDLSSGKPKRTDRKSRGKSIIKKMLILFFLISLFAAGGFFGYLYLLADKPGVVVKSELPKEILLFSFNVMPLIHADIVSICEEIEFTEGEIKRIDDIAKEFPAQKRITDTERKLWGKNLLNLNKFRIKQEKEIRDIYVSYRVNIETGLKLIEEKKEELNKSAGEIITPSKELTDKLRAVDEAKSFLDKLKEKVF